MKLIVLVAMAVAAMAVGTAVALSLTERSAAPCFGIGSAELAAAVGRDVEGLCCSLNTGGPCADPDDWPWESGCICNGLHCCSCTNAGAQCFVRTSTLELNDECKASDATNPMPHCGEVDVTPCFTYKHGTCGDDAGGFNPFAPCLMCGCDITGAATKLHGSAKACTATSTGC